MAAVKGLRKLFKAFDLGLAAARLYCKHHAQNASIPAAPAASVPSSGAAAGAEEEDVSQQGQSLSGHQQQRQQLQQRQAQVDVPLSPMLGALSSFRSTNSTSSPVKPPKRVKRGVLSEFEEQSFGGSFCRTSLRTASRRLDDSFGADGVSARLQGEEESVGGGWEEEEEDQEENFDEMDLMMHWDRHGLGEGEPDPDEGHLERVVLSTAKRIVRLERWERKVRLERHRRRDGDALLHRSVADQQVRLDVLEEQQRKQREVQGLVALQQEKEVNSQGGAGAITELQLIFVALTIITILFVALNVLLFARA